MEMCWQGRNFFPNVPSQTAAKTSFAEASSKLKDMRVFNLSS